jgi:DNA invertase Pin-like site-specific DNA recombinase
MRKATRTPRQNKASTRTSRSHVFGARVALYTRVSTADQHTLPQQLRKLRELAKRRGWRVVREVREVASGRARRALRDELVAAARRREIDAVLVWKLDRWGRSVSDLVETLHELDAVGVAFVSLTEAIDMTTPSGRALAGMLAVFAEFERDILRERIREGLERARRDGVHLGRPQSVAVHAPAVRRLYAQGLSKRAIGRELGIGDGSVRRLLADGPRAPRRNG